MNSKWNNWRPLSVVGRSLEPHAQGNGSVLVFTKHQSMRPHSSLNIVGRSGADVEAEAQLVALH